MAIGRRYFDVPPGLTVCDERDPVLSLKEGAMNLRLISCLSLGLCVTMAGRAGLAAPWDFKLLPLVPPGSQIVSGFKAPQDRHQPGPGSLLFVTELNRLDLKDWVSLCGVDPNRSVNEVLQAAFAPPGEMLREHLLLMAGTFQRERIFDAAERNGAKRLRYLGENVLAIEPFDRERLEMTQTRWLAIFDNSIVVFGTRWMVQQAIGRFQNRAAPDDALLDLLTKFNADVDTWSVMRPLPKIPQNEMLDSHSLWTDLFERAEVRMLAVHSGSKFRVDATIQTSPGSEFPELTIKAVQFGQIFLGGGLSREESLKRVRIEGMKEHWMRASIVLSSAELLAWKSKQLHHNQELLDVARKGKAAPELSMGAAFRPSGP